MTRTLRRAQFERDFVRIEAIHQHPLYLLLTDVEVPRREISLLEAWSTPLAVVLLVAGLFGFAWVCGCWS